MNIEQRDDANELTHTHSQKSQTKRDLNHLAAFPWACTCTNTHTPKSLVSIEYVSICAYLQPVHIAFRMAHYCYNCDQMCGINNHQREKKIDFWSDLIIIHIPWLLLWFYDYHHHHNAKIAIYISLFHISYFRVSDHERSDKHKYEFYLWDFRKKQNNMCAGRASQIHRRFHLKVDFGDEAKTTRKLNSF